MISMPFRTRLALTATAVVAVLAGAGGVGAQQASAVEPIDLRVDDDDYWACLALDHVELGTCLENPLPDLSGLPSIPQLVDDVLRSLGLGQAENR